MIEGICNVASRDTGQSTEGPKDPTAFLAELLSSRVRARVVTWLVARQDAAHSLTEIARGVQLAVSSVQHECYKLERLGILHGRPIAGSRRYRLDRSFPVTTALIDLVGATHGLPALAHAALADLTGTPGLEAAALSRVDGLSTSAPATSMLVLIGDLSLDQLTIAHERIARLLDITDDDLQVAFYQPEQWRSHIADGHPLVARLRANPTIQLIGVLFESPRS